jgi:recombination protein RecR
MQNSTKYPSELIEKAVEEVAKLPGIGKKSALRLVIHLLKQQEDTTLRLCEALTAMRHNTKYCKVCHNVADGDLCSVCLSTKRDTSLICVVEDIRDVMAIENTMQYYGLYHVLGGVISPIEGIGPNELNVATLLQRVQPEKPVKEVIFALSANLDTNTTIFYLKKELLAVNPKLIITKIARGVPIGSELEFTDEVTLGLSIQNRVTD